MTAPTLDEIDRIARLSNPILRNLQITQCYYEISQSVAGFTGDSANWCTFATWASKQAGQTIRQEDLIRTFEERSYLSDKISAALEGIVSNLRRIGARLHTEVPRKAMLRAINPGAAFARAGDAVARGNKKVFEEIGREFARFLEFFGEQTHFEPDKTARFFAGLRAGEPPEGQRLLSQAFTSYCEARFQNGQEKAELMLLANLSAGFHEQIRLQPEIVQALNAAIDNAAELKRNLMTVLLPDLYVRAREKVLRGQMTYVNAAFARLIEEVNRLIRQVITDHLMTLHLAGAEVLRLGRDLQGAFPQELGEIRNPKLREMLERIDITLNSLVESGAKDWADFTDRMHFIADFFRVYQERQQLFEAPFTTEQVALLKRGAKPDGRL
ncbi:MAG TPA: hypothetical protein VF089_17610 [Candidatus Binatia bacterium]